LTEPPFSEMAFVRMWLKHLYVNGTLKSCLASGAAFEKTDSVIERRLKFLQKALIEDRGYFRTRKTRWGEMSDWEKPIFLMGATCLPQDEFSVLAESAVAQLNNPFAKTYCSWLKAKHGQLASILRE